ncbi:MAG: cysteine desulfurase [Lentimonas sp.]|jgi:cysteine desulfurase
MQRIYLDNNATTKIDPKVLEVMNEVYLEPLNPSSTHSFGRKAAKVCNESRKNIKKLLGAENYQVIFTSGGTESNNLALLGFKDYQLIASEIEHLAVYNVVLKKNGSFVKVDSDGIVNIDDLEQKIKQLETKNFIVSIMLANNETGIIQPIKEIAKMVHSFGGLIHSDIIQAAGKIEIDLEDLNIDLASISGHKLNGPQGTGALLIRNSLDIDPILFGSSQEGGKRAGTVNVAGSVGLGEAFKLALEKPCKYQELADLRNYLEDEIKKIAGEDVVIFGKNVLRLPNTTYFATLGIDNQTQLIEFDLNGIAISIGSACSSGSSKPSKVLSSMNVADDIAKNTIRVSLGLENSKEQINKFITVWRNLYQNTKN